MGTLAVHSTGSSAPMYPDKNVKLYKIVNAVQCTMKYVWISTEPSMTATQKLNVPLSTRMTVNSSGRERVTPRSGFQFLEHVNPTPMRPARMFPNRRRDRFPTLCATRYLNRSVLLFPSRSAGLSMNRNAPMNHTRSVIRFPSKIANLSTRRFPTGSAEGSPRRFVMVDLDLDLVPLLLDLDLMLSSLSKSMIPNLCCDNFCIHFYLLCLKYTH